MAAAGVRRAGGRFRARENSTGGANAYFLGGDGFSRILEEASAPAVDSPATAGREASPVAAAAASAMAARITPAVLFVTVVLAVVLLVSGLLHVLRRLFLKTNHASAGGGERQLQHLFFPAHEDGAGSGGGGLGQAAIDALPEFAYGELSGAAAAAASRKGKEKAVRAFDCAVCLCEFADDDRLRLLPACGHAFHVACIDVWLRSSATCPLCRTKLSARQLAAAADAPSVGPDVEEQKEQQGQAPNEAAASSVVLPVRLGRFTSTDGDAEASTSATSRIDARRCYSMGSYQYVLADEHLLVSVHMRHCNAGGAGAACGTGTAGVTSSSSSDDQHQGNKKVFARGDSFSVSKIWQWRGSKRLPASLCADDGLAWAPAAKDPAGAHTRQQQHSDT
ncbi:RING-H2 finger protein ATL46 [Dichanthelium oligosanthes]|uniref:RING-H2 finger protein ATL46 n=1 Tax=Dichanthelium oligosanthes TaxID=888268 RepID=A0A1E5VK64_9POAL|nr:RING-H2 finger protein ATL46 [Dichanthelium oligosanthes]